MKIDDVISELEIKYDNQSSKLNYDEILIFLLGIYKKVNKDVIILDYYNSKQEHRLSFKFANDDHFKTIILTNKYLELSFNYCEQMFFFDNQSFIKNYESVISSFFKGDYATYIYENDKGKSIFKEIIWKNDNLEVFNEKYQTSRRDNYSNRIKIAGNNYLDW